MGRLSNKIALVTGAGGGIGRAIAVSFAAEGAKVYVSDIDEKAAATVAEDIAAAGTADGGSAIGGSGAVGMACDVTDAGAVAALLSTIKDRDARLDLLVNNAGLNVRSDFRHMSDDDWQKLRSTNLDGALRLARDSFDLLKTSGNAAIINVSSIMARRSLRQLAGYSVTKGAMSALTRALAVEYAPFGIRVNSLAPGFIETGLTERIMRNPIMAKALIDSTPLRRFGTPEDVAKAALFLASDDAAFVTGSELTVDGGMTAAL